MRKVCKPGLGAWPRIFMTCIFRTIELRSMLWYSHKMPSATVKINICTASAPVLESLADNLGEYNNPELLTSYRKTGCFPDPTALGNILKSKGPGAATTEYYGVKSDYFRLTTRITLGTTEFTLYSLLKRDGSKTTPLLRSFGTP